MGDIFKNYPQPDDYVPDNSGPSEGGENADEVVVNGTTVHVFKLNFSYSELCDGFEVTYRSGLDGGFSIKSSDLGGPFEILEEDGRTYITITLSPELTSVFDPLRDAYAQMRLNMRDGTTLYGDLNKLEVMKTI